MPNKLHQFTDEITSNGVDDLRIVHVVLDPDAGTGRSGAIVGRLAGAQASRGHHVRIVTLEKRGSLKITRVVYDAAIEIRRVTARRGIPVREILRGVENADVVHLHAIDPILDFMAMTKWLHKRPLILSTHDTLRRDGALRATVNRNSIASCGYATASSEEDAETLRKLRSRGMRVVEDVADSACEYEGIYRHVLGRDSRYLLGAQTSVTKADRLIETIDGHIAQRIPIRLAFLNANLANFIAKDDGLGETLRSFTLVNDGVGVDIASRLLYRRRFPQNLNGTDFTPHFLDRTSHRLKLYLLGATREALDAAVEQFRVRWPQHMIVGVQDGFFGVSESAAIVQRIEAADPDLVLVGMGNPRQEQWIAQHLRDYRGSAFAVGALFDFISGRAPRAPQWVRRIRAEWVYRLALEPGRMWRRYLIGNFVFLSHVFAQMMRGERAL